ncbi:MAG: hypothetical protein ACN2B6_00240 [Rickettsiales bacterium]
MKINIFEHGEYICLSIENQDAVAWLQRTNQANFAEIEQITKVIGGMVFERKTLQDAMLINDASWIGSITTKETLIVEVSQPPQFKGVNSSSAPVKGCEFDGLEAEQSVIAEAVLKNWSVGGECKSGGYVGCDYAETGEQDAVKGCFSLCSRPAQKLAAGFLDRTVMIKERASTVDQFDFCPAKKEIINEIISAHADIIKALQAAADKSKKAYEAK